MNILITIALSTYNVASYLDKTLSCILNQSYEHLDILCIDDCSTDGTYEILQKSAELDNRIRLIRQSKNMGLSVSRNLALQKTKGEYVIFLDGDDCFDLDLVSKAYNKAIEADADMVMWDYCPFNNEAKLKNLLKKGSLLVNIDPKDKVALLKLPAFTWVRMLKTETKHTFS